MCKTRLEGNQNLKQTWLQMIQEVEELDPQ